ncbi:MAG: transglycosylase domain-containing protein, partial [Anaerolineales bacterium]
TPASPALESGRWLPLQGAPAFESIPEAVAQAAVAALDPTFWTNPGYEAGSILTSFRLLRGSEEFAQLRPGITERLVEITLLPFELDRREPIAHWVRRAFQSARLTEQYPKERILEWFLNTADFGRSAFGLDAAAMAYLNKRGHELTLGESASLVGLLLDGSVEAAVDLGAARRKRDHVLESMAEQGLIGRGEARLAMREELRWTAAPSQALGPAAEFSAFVREELRSRFGEAAGRPGLRVRTTLDYDLQLQADCTVWSHLAHMAGGDPDAVLAARDESACIVAGLLSPLRPGDAGRDHGISSAALVVLDAAQGEVLAWVGPSDAERPAEPVFRPFVYLAAFARGYAPGTMVLDLPPQGSGAVAAGGFRGPVRMRIGLANGLVGATQHTLNLLDIEQVIHVARQMGLRGLQDPEPGAEESWTPAQAEASLLELAHAYSVIAHGGRMTGVETPGPGLVPGSRQIDPIVILSVEDPTGTVYEVEPIGRSVLSPGLAFVMSDVLTDESARVVSQSGLGISGVGRVAGVVDGEADGGRQHWTVGFSSPRVVGMWVSADEGEILSDIDAYNGSAPVWRAVLQYATRDLAFEPMPRPPGITDLEVCDPSGLLPTAYCPNIVREIFLQGTEPLHYDTLFRPFQVNRETGKLATLFTPLELIEQRVYLIPPAEAEAWARSVGLERPPTEYDAVGELPPQDPQVNLQRPIAFEALRRTVVIRGSAAPDSLDFFRLQYGEGLNPT